MGEMVMCGSFWHIYTSWSELIRLKNLFRPNLNKLNVRIIENKSQSLQKRTKLKWQI